MESNALHYFLNMSRACLFLIQEVIYIANVKALSHQSVMNKPQAEGKVNSRLYSRTQEKKFNTLQQ